MASQEPIFDSPTAWVQKHIQDYVESDGVNGHQFVIVEPDEHT